jgi:hypothetical protein
MIDAMKQALEIIKNMRSGYGDDYHTGKEWRAMEALRQAIEQAEKESTLREISDIGQEAHTDHPMRHWDRTCPACVAEAEKQEPVAWMTNSEQDVTVEFLFSHVQTPMHKIPLYTTPPKREWVGLTAEEIYNCWQSAVDENGFTKRKVYDAIEAKLKEKNT